MTGNNPVDRSKLGQAKRHILTDEIGIPLSAAISSASTHDIKVVTEVIDNAVVVIKPPEALLSTIKTRRKNHQHLCLDRAYNSKPIENEIIKRGYVPHIPYKRKRGQLIKNTNQKRYSLSKNKRWVVERTNSWHNRFRKLFTNTKRRLRTTLDWCNYLAVS